jgi:hypothetical protein
MAHNPPRRPDDDRAIVESLIALTVALGCATGRANLQRAGNMLRDIADDPRTAAGTSAILQDIVTTVEAMG